MNEYAMNAEVLPALIVFLCIAVPVFGYFYNRWIEKLTGPREHMSIYVAIGVLVTIAFGSIVSWKGALLYLALFFLDGIFMIAGEYKRTEDRKQAIQAVGLRRKHQRKRLPYAANARIEDAYDSIKEAQRLLGVAFKNNGKSPESSVPMAQASHEISAALISLVELKAIQMGDE